MNERTLDTSPNTDIPLFAWSISALPALLMRSLTFGFRISDVSDDDPDVGKLCAHEQGSFTTPREPDNADTIWRDIGLADKPLDCPSHLLLSPVYEGSDRLAGEESRQGLGAKDAGGY